MTSYVTKDDTEVFHDEAPEEAAPIRWSKPEHFLLFAVLEDCLRLISRSPDPDVQRQEREWIYSNEDDRVFSFIHICTELDIDPAKVRRRVEIIPPVEQKMRVGVTRELLPRYIYFVQDQRKNPYRVELPLPTGRYLRRVFGSLEEARAFVAAHQVEMKPKRKNSRKGAA